VVQGLIYMGDWIAIFSGIVVAIATVAIAFFTYTLNRSTSGMFKVAREQSNDMKATIVLTHRPKLHVRNVVVRQPRPVHAQQPRIFAEGHLVSGQFYVVNVGGTEANITGSYCLVHWRQHGLPMERPYEGENPTPTGLTGITLQPGETAPGIFQSENPMGPQGEDIRLGNAGWRIYVMGWIEYTDAINVRRRTAFCREYQIRQQGTSEGRFYPVDDPDYEHEE
jgi:hypothetical protein